MTTLVSRTQILLATKAAVAAGIAWAVALLADPRWRGDPAQWLTRGTILAMSQRILAELSSPLDPPDEAAVPRA